MSKITFGILIPAYNEERRLPIDEFIEFLENHKVSSLSFKLVFLDDGSTDNTLEMLLKLKEQFKENIEVCGFEENQGKAETVRKGLLKYSQDFEYLGYLDADLATGLDEFLEIGILTNSQGKKMGFGSRIKKLGSAIDRKLKRHLIGRVFATFANGIVKVPIYDTQCGAKYFHHSLIEPNFHEPFISKWLFDIEIICRVLCSQGRAFFLENAIEVPLKTWKEKGESKIRGKDFLSFPLELWKIKKKYANQMKD